MYKLVLWTGVWSTTGLLCQASATNPSCLSTVQPISLGSKPPSPSVQIFPYSNLWMWLIHEVEVIGRNGQKLTGIHGIFPQREKLFSYSFMHSYRATWISTVAEEILRSLAMEEHQRSKVKTWLLHWKSSLPYINKKYLMLLNKLCCKKVLWLYILSYYC